MGFSLKKLVKHIGDDFDPFDGPQQPPQPASTARPQQTQQGGLSVQPVQQQTLLPPIQPIKPPTPLTVKPLVPQQLQVGNQTIQQDPNARNAVPDRQPQGSLHDEIGAAGAGVLSSAAKAGAATARGITDLRFATPNFIPGVSHYIDPAINKISGIAEKPFNIAQTNLDNIAANNGLYDTKAGQQGKAIGNVIGASTIYAPQIPGAVEGGIQAVKAIPELAKGLEQGALKTTQLVQDRQPLNAVGGAKAGDILPEKAFPKDEQNTNYSPAPTTKLVPTPPTPVEAPIAPTQAIGEGSGFKPLSTPQPAEQLPIVGSPIDTKQYIKQQSKLQDTARKLDQPQGLGKATAFKNESKQKFLDSFAPIEDTLNKAVKNGAEVAPENNIKYQLDRAIRGDTIGAQYIKDKGLANIIQNVPKTKEFDQYLIAKHAADLEKNGVETGRNLPADAQLVKQLASKYEPHAQALKQYSQGLLDTAQGYGLISKDLATHLKEKYPNYVPVNRIFSEDELQQFKGQAGGKASLSQQSVVQKIKGSKRQIESPLSSLIDKSIQVTKEGERNKAAQILTGYRDLPDNPFQLRELGKDEVVGSKPVISTIENGVTRRFETTPEIANAAKSLTKEQLGLVGRILSVPTRVLRLGATGLNPAFALANVTKDTVSAFINSSHPLRASAANPKVFMAALKASVNHNSQEYGELVRQGAGGTSFDIARNSPVQNVRSIRAQKNVGSKVLYTVTKPSQLFRAAENTIGRSEEFNRAVQYFGNKQAALKGGKSLGTAQILGADAARNDTVNFARAGEYGRVLNSVLPYLNAGIQGSRTLLRNLKDRPAQTGAKLALTTFFPVAAVTAWNTSSPDRKAAYDDVKQYEKQGSLVIVPPNPVKDKNGKWNVIKIPMSQEIANLADVVRNGVESGVHDGSIHVADLLGNVAGTVTSLNAQSPRQLIGQLTPQAIKPAIESLVNENLFTGNQIVPDSQKNLPGRDQIGQNTSGTATEIGKFTGLSPRNIDNFISTAAGGLGQNIVNASDQALAKSGVIKSDQVKGKTFGSSITGRFEGAQGQSPYDIADGKFKDLSKQLENLPGYQSMSSQDKAKALNRLQNQVTDAFVPSKDSSGNQKALTSRQQDITGGTPDLSSYLTAQSGGSNDSDLYKSNDAEYKSLQKKFDDNVKNNKFNSPAKQMSAQDTLNKAKVGADFDKKTRDLYGLNKTEIADYLATDPDGKNKAKQLVAYDQALTAAGIQAKNKFKNGQIVASSSGGSSSSGKKAAQAFASALQASNAAASKNQSAIQNLVKGSKLKSSAKSLNVTKVALKKQSTKKQKAKIS